MIVTENVTMYKCSYCPKRYFRKQDIVKHEFNCKSNPKNFSACSGCIHLEEGVFKYIISDSEEEGGPWERETKSFVCDKLKTKMYPFKVVKKGLLKKYPDSFKDQIQMPSTCELFTQSHAPVEWDDFKNEDV